MTLHTATLFASAWLLGLGAAHAAPCTAASNASARVAGASTDDVTLQGAAADRCHLSLVNPQGGPNGDASAFSAAFGSNWSLLAKIDSSGRITPDPAAAGPASLDLDFGLRARTNTAGTWTVMSDRSITLDLVFAMHAGGTTTAFLFDNEALAARTLAAGDWTIEWRNNGNRVPAYSNLTLFYRDVSATTPSAPPSEVPLPGALGLLAAGAACLALSRRRAR